MGILHKIKRHLKMCMEKIGIFGFYLIVKENTTIFKALVCKSRYSHHIHRLRAKPKSKKIRVLFIVSEIAKWKEQKLYEAMEKSGIFEPIVGLSAWNRQCLKNCGNEELQRIHDRAEGFFDRMGDKHVRTVIVANNKRIFLDLSTFEPDIVYYTEPWGPCPKQDPWTVSKFALTLYTPYFTPNYGIIEWDCHQPFHRLLFGYFCLNQAWCDVYEKSLRFVAHSTRFVPAGHPGLDFISNECVLGEKEYVIYAPHYSFPNPNIPDQVQRYSTFDWNGFAILEYAKKHRSIKWVFKPHPLLREWVKKSGIMSQSDLDDYFSQWKEIGIVCEDGDYHRLFLESRAMITDCGSFLTEYGATCNPIIHLISKDNKFKPIFLMENVYATYYQVHDLHEMDAMFKMVLEERKDPNRENRIREVERAGIRKKDSSSQIVEYIKNLIKR